MWDLGTGCIQIPQSSSFPICLLPHEHKYSPTRAITKNLTNSGPALSVWLNQQGYRCYYEQRGKYGIEILPLCRNYPQGMVTPDIETSTREERLEFIREEFKCLGNCPICGKCSFLRGREAEDLYADYIEGHRSFRDITAEHRNSIIS